MNEKGFNIMTIHNYFDAGSKWVANKWIREYANAFHNKCVDHIDK